MPLNTQIVAQQTQSFKHEIGARWTMAYASGLYNLVTEEGQRAISDGFVCW
ncbi:MAG: hypothetical protein O6945_06945 [Gammaproteobacteria bacterium]|nr:hypothetical protein [Gammaproteobacteria bacterium]